MCFGFLLFLYSVLTRHVTPCKKKFKIRVWNYLGNKLLKMFLSVIATDVCVWNGLKLVWHLMVHRSTPSSLLLLCKTHPKPQNSRESESQQLALAGSSLGCHKPSYSPGACLLSGVTPECHFYEMPVKRVLLLTCTMLLWLGAFPSFPRPA